jgi:hypothetical protein
MYQITVKATAEWIGEGTGVLSVPASQSLAVTATQAVAGAVGGSALTSGEVTTACSSLGTLVAGQLNTATNLAIMQGWASGSP